MPLMKAQIVAVSDAIGVGLSRGLAEEVTLTDLVGLGFPHSLTETVTATDATACTRLGAVYGVSGREVVTASDVWTINTGGPMITGLPGPKPVRYWNWADLDLLRQAILEIDSWGASINPLRGQTTVWDDVLGDVSQGLGTSALTVEAYPSGSSFVMFHMRWDQVDSLSMRFQMPHRWKRDTEVRVHIHYVPTVAPSSSPENVRLSGRYAWAHYATAIPAWASWTPFTADIPIATGDENKEGLYALFATTPTGSYESSVLLVYLQRDGAAAPGGNDTYETSKGYGTNQANFGILYLDAHFQADGKLGTTKEIPE